ncbi:MATE family efflux transporter [Robbsia sp. Bb-Pol-6]|uniref:MATE family efflux transporter n=1 Tax=Robbsia betulipollinis TaxID=2981849 RepID=A0ABT3ZLI6_9BURK|nr:MATE family efflux transporter [Robbsia betulipollinis]MCY0387399.1 MATE family efflux transporter [Robbsia betulipollinis]
MFRKDVVSVPRHFFSYAASAVAAAWIYCTYMVIDGLFISHYIGSSALATLSLALPVVYLPYAFSVLIGVGASTLISRAIGEGRTDTARAIFTQALWLMAGAGVALALLLYFGSPLLLRAMNVDGDLQARTVGFLRVSAGFGIFTVFACALEFFLRVDGAARYGLYCLAVSALLNIVLDYAFIAHLGWGLNGAALATGLSQIVATVPMLAHHLWRSRRLRPVRRPFAAGSHGIAIVCTGLAEFLIELAPTVTIVAFNWAILARLGNAGLEVFAVIEYMTMISAVTLGALVQSMQPIVAFHRGGGRPASARRAFRLCGCCVFGFSALVALVMIVFWQPIGMLFSIEATATLAMLKTATLWYALALLPAAANFLLSGYLTAREQLLPATAIATLRSWIGLLAMLWLLPRLFVTDGVWLTVLGAELLTLPFALWLYRNRGAC